MANARGKRIDTTHLSSVEAKRRGFIHRDYLAHCLRYSHVAKYLMQQHRYKTHHVLDVGCGKEVPLARLMFSMKMTHTTGSYVGVDYGSVPWPDTISQTTKKFKLKLLEKTDFVKAALPRKQYDVVSCLEVLEHVEADHAYQMLLTMKQHLKKDGVVFLSTPCYDPKLGAAANHVNEMSFEGFKALIQAAGFRVDKVWGTFASQKDYKKIMEKYHPGITEIFTQLSEYYDSNVVACLFAPLFPSRARNCLWQVSCGRVQKIAGKELKELCKPEHGSSSHWAKHLKGVMK